MKAALRRFLSATHVLFLIFLAVQLLPDTITREQGSAAAYSIGLAAAMELALIVLALVVRKQKSFHIFNDIAGFVYFLLILWVLATAKFNLLKEAYFPPPGIVLHAFVTDIKEILSHVQGSVLLILEGYLLALAAAIPLGLVFGWSLRLGNAATYITKFVGSIPPIVYIPYGLVLLPTLRSVSVFVIFLASFWPVLASTMSGVLNVEKRIIDSAKVLNVNKLTMLFRIILPAALPQVFIGCNQGLSVSFILLISAEMLGSNSGMGYYIQNNSDWGNYPRVLVGVFVIGVVITLIVFLFNRLQRHMLRWKQ